MEQEAPTGPAEVEGPCRGARPGSTAQATPGNRESSRSTGQRRRHQDGVHVRGALVVSALQPLQGGVVVVQPREAAGDPERREVRGRIIVQQRLQGLAGLVRRAGPRERKCQMAALSGSPSPSPSGTPPRRRRSGPFAGKHARVAASRTRVPGRSPPLSGSGRRASAGRAAWRCARPSVRLRAGESGSRCNAERWPRRSPPRTAPGAAARWRGRSTR